MPSQNSKYDPYSRQSRGLSSPSAPTSTPQQVGPPAGNPDAERKAAMNQQIDQLLAALTQQGSAAGAQMGNLGGLAAGNIGPNAQDQALVQQSIGASGDMARRQLEQFLAEAMPQVSSDAAARGLSGSSIEAANRAITMRGASQQFADLMSQQQQQGAQALMQLPFQRAQTQMGANQLLFQQLMGAVTPVTNTRMQQMQKRPKPNYGQAIGQVIGMGVGAMAGGPAGAAVGGQMGGAVGGAGYQTNTQFQPMNPDEPWNGGYSR